jgi:hypothetical protein
MWVSLYPPNKYEGYSELIAKHKSFSAADFVQIGKWKDAAKTEGRWKPNVPRVAYRIWMLAASELPKCPEQSGVAEFLDYWSNRKYTDEYESGPREISFGLSRATTLLHFISGGRYPIFDSRVRRALARLLDSRVPPKTVPWYLGSYCLLFSEIAALCRAEDLRAGQGAL